MALDHGPYICDLFSGWSVVYSKEQSKKGPIVESSNLFIQVAQPDLWQYVRDESDISAALL